MTRIAPVLSATAVAAFLAFGGSAAFAMATGPGNGGHPAGGPNGPGSSGPAFKSAPIVGCEYRADQQGLEGNARRAFLWRCQQSGEF